MEKTHRLYASNHNITTYKMEKIKYLQSHKQAYFTERLYISLLSIFTCNTAIRNTLYIERERRGGGNTSTAACGVASTCSVFSTCFPNFFASFLLFFNFALLSVFVNLTIPLSPPPSSSSPPSPPFFSATATRTSRLKTNNNKRSFLCQ